MITAYMSPSQMVCLHVDRLHDKDSGAHVEMDIAVSFSDEALVPVFQTDQLDTTLISYTVVSATCHLGAYGGGHYCCILRMRTETGNTWILKGDKMYPSFHTKIPGWFLRGVNTLWLVHTDMPERAPIEEMEQHLNGQTYMPRTFPVT